jgi:RNA polymerase sigma-70 factor (ECF subfamily)
MLAFYNELSYSEIAQILNCPEGTVKSRVYYAKEQLKRILSEGGDL